MLVYGLGHKVKRTGQLNLIEAACYPRDASPANTGLAPPPTADQYPSVVLSTDKVHIKLGEFPDNLLTLMQMAGNSALLACLWRLPVAMAKSEERDAQGSVFEAVD